MASDAGAIKAGSAYVELFLRDRLTGALNATADKLQAWGVGVAKFGGLLTAVGAAVTGPAVAAVAAFAEQGVELLRLSQVTGTTVEALSTLQFAFGKVGVEAESLNTALVHMQAFLSEAIQGGKSARETLTRLGLSIGVLKNVPSDEKLRLIADALAKIGDETQRVAAAREIFGRGGAELLPGLNRGAQGLRELEDEARRLGLVMTNETAKASFDLLKNMNALTSGLKGAWFLVSKELLPILLELTAPLKDVKTQIVLTGRAVANWVKDNRELVGAVLKAGFAIGAAGAALVVLGGALKVAGLALGAPIVGITALGIGMATVEGETRTWGLALAALGVGLKLFGVNLLSPLGLTAALGTALVAMGGNATVAGAGVLTAVVAFKLFPVACAVASAAVVAFRAVVAAATYGLSEFPLVIAAVAAGVVALGTYFATTGNTVEEAMAAVTDAVGGAVDWVTRKWADLKDALSGSVFGDVAGAAERALGAYVGNVRAGFAIITNVGRGLFSDLSAGFRNVGRVGVTAWGGITDAIKAGDLGLAAQVGWAALKVLWVDGTNWLSAKWRELVDYVLDAWDTGVGEINDIAANAWADLQLLWVDLTEAITAAWDGVVAYFEESWPTLTAGFVAVRDAAVDAWGMIGDGLDWLGGQWDDFTDNLQTTWETVTAALTDLWEKFAGPVQRGLGMIGDAVGTVAAALGLEGAGGAIAAAVSGAIDAVSGEAGALTDSVTNAREANAPGFQSQRDAIEAQRSAALNPGEAGTGGRAEARTAAQTEADRRAEEARAALAEAVAAAARAREAKDAEVAARPGLPGTPGGSDLGKTSVAGTFSGAAVALLGGGGAAERTAKATEDTARGVERLTREVRNGGGFAVG